MSDHEYNASNIKNSTKIDSVIKRDGTLSPFDSDRIFNAILKAILCCLQIAQFKTIQGSDSF